MHKNSASIYFAVAFATAQAILICSLGPANAAETTQATPSPKTGTMSQPVGTPESPKPYQPANPAPDTRSAPTTSSTGVGSDSGGQHNEQK